ncbi:hypothetical protein DKX38_007496 [Salix brachista]|uniref:Uncharacterized protein n=1 Tax=Salix brachista TaxID=2182728 RepID=A0A5N5MNM2_9ROSI|nr:hypothetical protein DKX38_007496 [Salix brachista]
MKMEALITLLALQGRSLHRDPEIGDRGVGALAGAIMKESEDPRSRLCLHFEGLGSLVRLSALKNVIQDHFPKMRKPGAWTTKGRRVDQMTWHVPYRTNANQWVPRQPVTGIIDKGSTAFLPSGS